LQLLEVEPNADGDSQYFEKEEYGTISALLGEGAKSFLGIPPGPLQIGHFIGFLGISLCAFVSYPGFPLTNLPTPIRDALQGGKCFEFICDLSHLVYNFVLRVRSRYNHFGKRGTCRFLSIQSKRKGTTSSAVGDKGKYFLIVYFI